MGLLAHGEAWGQSWSGVITDIPGTRADQLYRPDVTVDAAGNAMVVWRRGSPNAIQAARYDAASRTWSQPVDLAVNVRPELFPVVAGDDLGNVVAAWTTDRSANNLIRVARYSAAAGTWAEAQTIAQAGTTGEFGELAIAGNDSGDVVLVWTRRRPGWAGGTVQSARYIAALGTWSAAVNLSVTDGFGPLIAMDAAGNAMAVWAAGSSAPSQFARYTAASGTWTSATNGPMPIAQIEFDGAGNAIAVGFDQLAGQDRIFVKAVRYTASSASWNTPVIVSPDTQRCLRLDLAVDAGGNAVVIWDFQDLPASSGRFGIHAAHYTAASETWSDVNLVRDAWWHTTPRVTVDATGNVLAAWHVAGAFSPAGILSARRPAGGTWEAPVTVRRRFTQWDSPLLAPTLPVDQAGNVTLVWEFFDSPAAGSSLESTHWLANGTGSGPPGAPVSVAATVSGNAINLRWNPPSSGGAPTSYTLVGRLTSGGPVLATVPMGAGTSFSVAAPNGTFVLSVVASNAAGAGPESTSVTVTVPQAGSPPGPPTNFAAGVTGTTVSFAWSAPSSGGAVTNYVLVAGLTPGFTVPFATVPLGATPGFVVPGVPAGTFYVRVVAQNASGTSAPSNEVVFTVAGTALPGAPTLHAPTVSGSTVSLSWSAGSGGTPTGYTLLASVTPAGPPSVTVPLVGTSTSFPGVPSGTYYLRLTASNAAGTSPPSAEVMLTVP